MAMHFHQIKDAIAALLSAQAAGQFQVRGHQDQNLSAEEIAGANRLVQVSYSSGEFSKSASGRGPFDHQMTFAIRCIVSEPAHCDLSVLGDPGATQAQLAAALSAVEPAASAADSALDQLVDDVFQILMAGDSLDLEYSEKIGSRWIGRIDKVEPQPAGDHVVVSATMDLTCRIDESVGSTEMTPIEGISVDLIADGDSVPRAAVGVAAQPAPVPELNFTISGTGVTTFWPGGPEGSQITVYWGDGHSDVIIFSAAEYETVTHDYAGASGVKNVRITGDVAEIDYFWSGYQGYGGDFAIFAPLTSLRTLVCAESQAWAGDLAFASALENLEYLDLVETGVVGNIAALAGSEKLTRLSVWRHYLTPVGGVGGALSSISHLHELVSLLTHQTQIVGQLRDIGGLRKMRELYLGFLPQLSGSLIDLGGLTQLNFFNIDRDLVIGDFSDLSFTNNLAYLHLSGTRIGVSSAPLPIWTAPRLFAIKDCNLRANEVDNCLIQLDLAGGTNGRIELHGGNAARTSASDAAKASLLSKNWTVLVNE